ncbi:hypothetical protein HGM15179_015657 [Zosterops borbonicus]|uniref:Uncharacterized protein n=1 Tax=Zosterops borbonicus TaxID=364589 RepID=A0A8K1G4F1_9PASS|nr:hypothetical protein HGM15179_015657 [Zosterops borbonicus]
MENEGLDNTRHDSSSLTFPLPGNCQILHRSLFRKKISRTRRKIPHCGICHLKDETPINSFLFQSNCQILHRSLFRKKISRTRRKIPHCGICHLKDETPINSFLFQSSS